LKNIIISLGFLAFLVVAYLVYDVLGRSSNPCGQLFEQTTASLTTKIDILEKDTSLVIGRNRLQELSSSAQQMALTLQSCCIAAQASVISGEQFLQCQTGTNVYASRLDTIVLRLAELEKSDTSDTATPAPPALSMTENSGASMPAELSVTASSSLQVETAPTSSLAAKKPPVSADSSVKTQLEQFIDETVVASGDFHKKVVKVTKD
jgi:hypothetical protein